MSENPSNQNVCRQRSMSNSIKSYKDINVYIGKVDWDDWKSWEVPNEVVEQVASHFNNTKNVIREYLKGKITRVRQYVIKNDYKMPPTFDFAAPMEYQIRIHNDKMTNQYFEGEEILSDPPANTSKRDREEDALPQEHPTKKRISFTDLESTPRETPRGSQRHYVCKYDPYEREKILVRVKDSINRINFKSFLSAEFVNEIANSLGYDCTAVSQFLLNEIESIKIGVTIEMAKALLSVSELTVVPPNQVPDRVSVQTRDLDLLALSAASQTPVEDPIPVPKQLSAQPKTSESTQEVN
jgi:hypothetical protein